MAADERDPRLVLVADSEGILVTKDRGCTWARSAKYADFVSPVTVFPKDAVVAGTGRARSLHVLVVPSPDGPGRLFSSFDDGASWTVHALPASGPDLYTPHSLAASPAVPDRVFLFANYSAASAVYAGDGRDGWRRQSLTLWSPEEACVSEIACASSPLTSLHADPSGKALWARSAGTDDGSAALAHSSDEGVSWRSVDAPSIDGGARLADVGPRSIALVGDFGEFALSPDGGRSWSVGEYPRLTSTSWQSLGVSEIAHFDRGTSLAIIPGSARGSEWSGNVLVFDGRRWANAAPAEFAGYDRRGEDGNRLYLESLTSTDGPLLALSSRGELMTFRPER